MSNTVVVTSEQVEAARLLVELKGGLDKVDPVIAKIAQAKPRPRNPDDRKAS